MLDTLGRLIEANDTMSRKATIAAKIEGEGAKGMAQM